MPATAHETRDIRPGRQRVSLAIAIGLCVPGAVSRLTGFHGDPGLMALIFGLAIVGAAFTPGLMRDGLGADYAELTRQAA